MMGCFICFKYVDVYSVLIVSSYLSLISVFMFVSYVFPKIWSDKSQQNNLISFKLSNLPDVV